MTLNLQVFDLQATKIVAWVFLGSPLETDVAEQLSAVSATPVLRRSKRD
jgi:hypothetical protein